MTFPPEASAAPWLTRELAVDVPDDGAGPRVTGLVHVPREVAAGRRRAPLVVLAHGLGESALRVAPLAQRLAAAGAVAVCPNLRGGGSPSGGPMTAMSVLTEVADVEAVLSAALTWGFVDGARVALFGRSQGGLVAGLVAARRPASFGALALWYPALGIPECTSARFRSRTAVPETFPHRVDGREVVLGRRYALDAWDLDPMSELRRFRSPVLLVHGTQDRDVPIELSERAARELDDARLVRVPGAAHGFGDERFETASARTVEFLCWSGVLG